MKFNLLSIAAIVAVTAGFWSHTAAFAGMIGSWQFNNSLVNDVARGSSANLAGSFASATYVNSTINGESATALSFPRSSSFADRIEIPNDAAASLNAYSVVVDFKFPIFQKTYMGFMEIDQRGSVDYVVRNNGSVYLFHTTNTAAGVFLKDTWHRVGVTRDALNNVRIYVDGLLAASGSGGLRGGPIQESGLWLFTDDNGEAAAGLVNSVALYDSVLSAADMARLGGASASGIVSNVVPEPTSVVMWCIGAFGMTFARRFIKMGLT